MATHLMASVQVFQIHVHQLGKILRQELIPSVQVSTNSDVPDVLLLPFDYYPSFLLTFLL